MGRNCTASFFSFTPSKQTLIKGNIMTEAKTFNLTFRNIDNVLSINNYVAFDKCLLRRSKRKEGGSTVSSHVNTDELLKNVLRSRQI
jgi:hypothetical protein